MFLRWMDNNEDVLQYLNMKSKSGSIAYKFIIQVGTYWVAYSQLIPISLYVIVEMLKLLQAHIVNSDIKMFFAEDMNYALCRNSDLIEELGQVEYVFSDKTGTLTQNKMEFKKCQAGGCIFGDVTEQDKKNGVAENEGMRNSSVM